MPPKSVYLAGLTTQIEYAHGQLAVRSDPKWYSNVARTLDPSELPVEDGFSTEITSHGIEVVRYGSEDREVLRLFTPEELGTTTDVLQQIVDFPADGSFSVIIFEHGQTRSVNQ